MKSTGRFLLAMLCLGLPLVCCGQLYVDYGGARDIFIQSSSTANSGTASNTSGSASSSSSGNSTTTGGSAADAAQPSTKFLSFDSQKEQVALNFLNLGQWPDQSGWVWGGTVTASSPNNDLFPILQFHSSPTVTGSVLANFTWGEQDNSGRYLNAQSVTVKLSNGYNAFALVTSASATKSTTKNVNEPSGSLCYAIAFKAPIFLGFAGPIGNQAIALTAGVARADDYQSLPQVAVSVSQTARIGPLSEFASYPCQLLYVTDVSVRPHTQTGNAWAWLLGLAGFTDTGSKLEVSPYANVAPRVGGSPSSGFGLNVALRVFNAKKQTIAYPWSLYLERDRKFSTDKYVTTGGVSKVFAF